MGRGLAVFPLKREMEFFLQAMKREGLTVRSFQEGSASVKVVEELELVCGVGGHGKVQFALGVQRLLLEIDSVTHLFCLGAAGGLHEDLNPGDVIIGEWTVEHDYKERFDPSHGLPTFRADRDWVQALGMVKPSGFSAYVGRIASGDEDIMERSRAEELVRQTDALAVAWEGAGGARAGRLHRVPFVEIRGITDTTVGGESVLSQFERNLRVAMSNVAQVVGEGINSRRESGPRPCQEGTNSSSLLTS